MIKYTLQCGNEHAFTSWFASIAAYEALARNGQLSCPTCGSTRVERAVMAPAVARTDRAVANPPKAAAEPRVTSDLEEQWTNRREFAARVRKIRDELLAKSEYVGDRFAEEARRIHEQTTPGEPPRPVHGEATADDVRGLLEDGIPVAPIPELPDDAN